MTDAQLKLIRTALTIFVHYLQVKDIWLYDKPNTVGAKPSRLDPIKVFALIDSYVDELASDADEDLAHIVAERTRKDLIANPKSYQQKLIKTLHEQQIKSINEMKESQDDS